MYSICLFARFTVMHWHRHWSSTANISRLLHRVRKKRPP